MFELFKSIWFATKEAKSQRHERKFLAVELVILQLAISPLVAYLLPIFPLASTPPLMSSSLDCQTTRNPEPRAGLRDRYGTEIDQDLGESSTRLNPWSNAPRRDVLWCDCAETVQKVSSLWQTILEIKN